jgi:hypothetical protein
MESIQSTSNSHNYDTLLKGSNVVESTFIEKKLAEEHENFDHLEFSKDIREIDFLSLRDSVSLDRITARYELPEAKGGAKSKSTSIQSFRLKTGDILGIGNN